MGRALSLLRDLLWLLQPALPLLRLPRLLRVQPNRPVLRHVARDAHARAADAPKHETCEAASAVSSRYVARRPRTYRVVTRAWCLSKSSVSRLVLYR